MKLNSIIHRLIDIHNIILNFSDNLVSLNHKYNREAIIKENEKNRKLDKMKDSRSPNIISTIQIDPEKYVQSLNNLKGKENTSVMNFFKEKKQIKKLSKSGDYNLKIPNKIKNENIKDLKNDFSNERTQLKNIKNSIKQLENNNIRKINNFRMITLSSCSNNLISNFNLIEPENSIFQNSQYESRNLSNPIRLKGSIKIRSMKINKQRKSFRSNDFSNNESSFNTSKMIEFQKNHSINSPTFKNLFIIKKNKQLSKNEF